MSSPPPTPALEELARKFAEEAIAEMRYRQLHGRLCPDSIVADIFLRAFAAHRELMKGELKEAELAVSDARHWLQELHDDGDAADWALDKHSELASRLTAALRTLDNLGTPK